MTQSIPKRMTQAIFIVLLLPLLVVGAYRGAMSSEGLRGVDSSKYYHTAQRLRERKNLYSEFHGNLYQDPFPYSPWIAILFRAMGHVTELQAYRIWLCVQLACLVVSPALMAVAIRDRNPEMVPTFAMFLIIGFRFWPTVCELALGNVDLVLLLLVCAMFWCARSGRWSWLALFVAAAAMLKTWMIGFAVAPLFARQFRQAFLAVLLAGLLLMISFAITGFHEIPAFLAETRRYAFQPHLVALSGPGLARQFFSDNVLMQPLIVSAALRWLSVAIAVGGAGLLSYRAFKHCGPKPDAIARGFLVPLCACLAVIVLPLCHLSYFILILPAIWLLIARFAAASPAQSVAMILYGLIAYLLLASPTPTLTPIPAYAQTGPARLLTALPLAAAVICAITIVANMGRASNPRTQIDGRKH